jgi:hypothetical protein
MEFRPDGFDVWVYRRSGPAIEYLLLRASASKAAAWFNGSQFWQIPSDFVGEGSAVDAIRRELDRFGLTARSLWAAEHTYTIYNRRYEAIVHLAVFAAEVEADEIVLGAEHDRFEWLTAARASERVGFRGLREGLHWVRTFVTESPAPLPELRLS